MDVSDTPIALHEAARHRYLTYALSVITSRALPDVRDGLKPVQRRILYAMYNNLHLTPEARYRKSAAVVGEVMAKFHPHGDSAIYEAMVRMAQDFALLHPLVDGQGNFGSVDGDGAAAMRYTEAKLRPIAMELLTELKQRTVDFRPTYDGQNSEPVVLPAQYPNLLVNGVEGIAVGMATRIPPHNLREVVDACLLLIEQPQTSVVELCRKVRAPDFPTGGELVSGADELRQVYVEGQGPVKVRGTWEPEQKGRKHYCIVRSIPYGVVKSKLVEDIGKAIVERKIPQLTDVRDESTAEVRVVLELRSAEDAAAAMAWLYRYTELQTTFHVNLTCLVPHPDPTDEAELQMCAPQRLDLKEVLAHWLDFRFQTVRRRIEHELGELKKRIHVLEGLARVFDALDEMIRIIRKSEGKRDAAEKLIARFDLSDEQAEAILELKLYKLAKLEINLILEELTEKQAAATQMAEVLSSEVTLWGVVRNELHDIRKQYGEPRRTALASEAVADTTFEEHAYIVAKDTIVVVTRGGWIKRQGTVTGVDKVRVREGDAVGWMFRSSTLSTVTLFSNRGAAYVLRVDAIPATTGHGEPVQKYFALGDGEQIVGVVSHDPRHLPEVAAEASARATDDEPPPPHVVAVSKLGRIVRQPLSIHADVSNRNGRRYMTLEKEVSDDEVLAAYISDGSEDVCVASRDGNLLCFNVWEVPVVKGAGKGVLAIKLKDDDRAYAFELSTDPASGPCLLTALGREENVRPNKYLASRAGRGHVLFRRGHFAAWKRPPDIRLGKPPEGGEAG